ncbi:MAG: RNA polymerase sigma factor, partial [Myxococcales bacterium]
MNEGALSTDVVTPGDVAGFIAGDAAVFLRVYQHHAADVRRWAAGFFRSPYEQEEAVQEIWLTVHRMRGQYDPARGPLRPWLKAVAANRCRELLRARGRRPQADAPLDDALADARPGPERAALLSRVREAIARFRAALTQE